MAYDNISLVKLYSGHVYTPKHVNKCMGGLFSSARVVREMSKHICIPVIMNLN